MKLSDALRFSRERKAVHAVDEGLPIVATDYGIERSDPAGTLQIPGLGLCRIAESISESWSQMDPESRKILLRSNGWEPIDPKPVMMVIAEAAADWSIYESDVDPDDIPEDEEYYA